MEVSLLSPDSVRIKGKLTSIVINPLSSSVPMQAAILIGIQQGKSFVPDQGIAIDGPGEYEVGGIKISGTRVKDEVSYSMSVDGVSLVIGSLTALSSAQQKLKEHNMVIALALSEIDTAFITSIAVNSVLFYGPMSTKAVATFGKEGVKEMPKYTTSLDKLPQELETVLLK